MKTLLISFFCFAVVSAIGQEPIEVKIENRPSSVGVNPAFEVVVPQATPDEAIDLVKETISPRGVFKKNPKVKKVEDEWHVSGVAIDEIMSRPLDVITQVSSYTGHIYVRFFFQRDGEFIGDESFPVSTEYAAKQFVHEYAVELYTLAVEKELKEAKKDLQKLENTLDKLGRKNSSFDDKINDAQKDQNDFDYEADYQRSDLRQAKNSEELSSEELKELEKELKSVEKELKKAKKEEARFDRKMNKNQKEQREITREIVKQEEVIKNIKHKLANIR